MNWFHKTCLANSTLYLFQKAASFLTTAILFSRLTSAEFVAYTGVCAGLYTATFWIKGASHFLIPLKLPQLNRLAITRFLQQMGIIHTFITIITMPIVALGVSYFFPLFGGSWVATIIPLYYVAESMSSFVRTIHYAQRNAPSIALVESGCIAGELAITSLLTLSGFSSSFIVGGTMGARIASRLVVTIWGSSHLDLSLFSFSSWRQIEERKPGEPLPSNEPASPPIARQAFELWGTSLVKSCGERNSVTSIIALCVEDELCAHVKIIHDAAIFTYRVITKTCDIADSSLIAHALQEENREHAIQKAHTQLSRTIFALALPLGGISLLSLIVQHQVTHTPVYQLFFMLIFISYLLDLYALPTERLLTMTDRSTLLRARSLYLLIPLLLLVRTYVGSYSIICSIFFVRLVSTFLLLRSRRY